MKVVASPDVAEYVVAHGGILFVWADSLAVSPNVRFLTASTDSPGSDRRFVRFAGGGFELLFDGGDAGVPRELHLVLRGRRRRHVRAYFDGRSFVHGRPPR